MSTPTDFSSLEAIEVIFVNDKHVPEPVYEERFGNTLELKELMTLFVDNDPAKGLRPDSELLPAFRMIVANSLIAPFAQETKDVSHISQLVDIAPLTVLNKQSDRMVRLNTRSTAAAMSETIQTGLTNYIEITVHIGTNVWNYPSTAPRCLEDFGLVEKDTGAANSTPATSAPTTTLSTNRLPFVCVLLSSFFLLHQIWSNMPPFTHVTQGVDWTQVNDVWNQMGWKNINLSTNDPASESEIGVVKQVLRHISCNGTTVTSSILDWKSFESMFWNQTGWSNFKAGAFRLWSIVFTATMCLYSSLRNLFWILSTIDSWASGYVMDNAFEALLRFLFLAYLPRLLFFLIGKFFQIGW